MNIFVCIVVWFFFPLIIYTQEMTKPIIRISYGCMTFSENKDLLGFYKKRHPALRESAKPVYGIGFAIFNTIPISNGFHLRFGPSIYYYYRKRIDSEPLLAGERRSEHNYFVPDIVVTGEYCLYRTNLIRVFGGLSAHYHWILRSKTKIYYGWDDGYFDAKSLSGHGFYTDVAINAKIQVNPSLHISPYLSYTLFSQTQIGDQKVKIVYPYGFRWGIAAEFTL
ncbi:hypothetical protein L6Q79_10890 [bacterium]|nr:hypothetical protein [bacterium]NUN46928.1 hypothetical protein [bacterium]